MNKEQIKTKIEELEKELEKFKKQIINEINDCWLNEVNVRSVCSLIEEFNFNDNNQNYKKAWEELRQYQIDLDKSNVDTLVKDNNEFYNFQRGNMMGHKNIGLKIKELEQKYNLGVE